MGKQATYSRNAVCPYFQSISLRTIKCDGIINEAVTKTVFNTEAEVHDFAWNNCCSIKYEYCPIYAAREILNESRKNHKPQ